MVSILVGLGSNLGDRLRYFELALLEIKKIPETKVKKISSVYETEPVGIKEQPKFFNAALELESSLSPQELFQKFKLIEQHIGRTSTVRWGPREIDIDLLYYDDAVRSEGGVRIPHPEVAKRRFVLVPLCEIAENFVDPILQMPLRDLLQRCSDTSAVQKTSLKLSLQNERF